MKRKAISKRTRFEVFKRDGFTCQYCGATPPTVILEADHIQPVSRGGITNMDNLITSCYSCNHGKAAIPLNAVPQSLAEKVAEIAEREAQIKGLYHVMEARRLRIEDEKWQIASALEGVEQVERCGVRRLTSIEIFLSRLPFHTVLAAAQTSRSRLFGAERMFRYFCGICWAKIKEAQNG